MTRLFVEKPLQPHAQLLLEGKQVHYLQHVMRLKAGDEILLFNGVDGEWRGAIHTVKKQHIEISLIEQTRQQNTDPPLHLLFAPIKRGHGDMVIEKATELGATRLTPILTQHTIVGRVPLDRYKAIAIEAAEQCERLAIPQIDDPIKLENLLQNWPAPQKIILCAEQGVAAPFSEIAQNLGENARTVLVGPEGGFHQDEFTLLNQHLAVTPAHLGPHILRADTAAIAALTLIQASHSHWKTKRA